MHNLLPSPHLQAEQWYWSPNQRVFTMKANGVDMFGAPVDVMSEVGHGNTLIKGTSWKADATSLQLTVRRAVKGRGRAGEGEGKGCALEESRGKEQGERTGQAGRQT